MPDRIKRCMLSRTITKKTGSISTDDKIMAKKILLTFKKRSFCFVLFETKAGYSSSELTKKYDLILKKYTFSKPKIILWPER